MEFDLDTANDIVINKSNPQYQRYHGGDKAVNEAVTAAFLRHIPGNIDLADSTPAALRGAAPAKPGDPQAGSEQADDPRTAALQESLRRDPEFGAAYEQNMARVQAALAETFGDRVGEIAAHFDGILTEAEKLQVIKRLAK